MKRTNAWGRLTESKAQEWNAWGTWNAGDKQEPEPPLDDWGKEMIGHIVDPGFSFEAYKMATIDTVSWRMGSLYGVTVEQMQEGYTAYPGEWSVVGMWEWMPGDARSALSGAFPYDSAEALLFMPDVCQDPPDCTTMVPASEVVDVVLLAGQPPREFPPETMRI